MEIFLTIRADRTLLALAARLIGIGQQIIQKENQIMNTLQEVVDDIAGESTMIGSVTTLISGLRDQIAALPGITPAMQAQIDGLFTTVEANKASLAAALLIGVPVQQPPTDVPPVVV